MPVRSTSLSAVAFAAACVVALGASSAFAASAGVADSTLKIRPGDTPQLDAAANLKAARNEFEPFQIVVLGGGSGVNGLTATASALTGPNGETIPASEVRLYREGYLNLTQPSNSEGGTGRWPDPLIPDVDEVAHEKRNAFPVNVPANENRVIFVDLHVPAGTTPGVYSGAVTLTGSNLGTVQIPVTVTVLHFTIPATSSLPTTFGMSWNAACVAHYGSYEACGGDDGIIKTHVQYAKFFLDHRITADVVYTGPSGAAPNFDWANSFDPHYGPLFDGTGGGSVLADSAQTTARYVWKTNGANYSVWADHFRAKGWLGKTYDYTCDEPPATCAWSDIPARASVVHGADPELRTLVTTNITEAKAHGVDGAIDIIVPVINHLDDKPGAGTGLEGNQRANYDAFLKSGPRKELWWYQSCMSHGCGGTNSYFTGWPSYMIDASGVQNRAMEWLTYSYDIHGELYFETLMHLQNAWNSVYDFGGNGDGTLLYPGRPDIIGGSTNVPVSSYRLKMIREGLEDYEYLHRLDQLGQGAWARSVVQGLFPHTYSARQPVEKLREAREILAAKLEELEGGGATIPTTPSNGALATKVATAAVQVKVDGDLTEFLSVTPVQLNGTAAGSDSGGDVRLLWDNDNLYAAFSVRDGTLRINEGGNDGEVWDGDGVELMIDSTMNRALAPDADDFHLGINVMGDLRDERGGASPWDRTWTSNAQLAVKKTGTGYDVEVAIPWKSMGIAPMAGSSFGFDLAINDSDSAGSVVPFDWAGLQKFAQPSKWGVMMLDSSTAGCVGNANGSPLTKHDGDANADLSAMGCSAAPSPGEWVPMFAFLSVAVPFALRRKRSSRAE